jgi:rubrerythrin
MARTYNAAEIYEMGIQIEKNGRAFYQAAADAADTAEARKLFEELRDWEQGHVELFESLKNELPQGVTPASPYEDVDQQAHHYLEATAGSHVFLQNQDVASLVADCQDATAVLKLALGFEKDSVVVYTSMKQLVPPKLGRDRIDRLIAEEIQHIAMLGERMSAK